MGMMGGFFGGGDVSLCAVCSDEVPDNEIGKCETCGMDGLCSKCQAHEEHEDLVDDGK
jgi:hypothetical protein